jgi:oligopeptide/dipeptide ABC transporter ATP-binding protein
MSRRREIVAEVRDATVAYVAPPLAPWRRPERVLALRGVTLPIDAGECVAVVGESGSGKSTLGRLFAGLVVPERGSVAPEGRSVGIVFQDPAASLDPRWTVGDALGEVLTVRGGLKRAAARARALELLAEVGLGPELAAAKPHELSGGQRQRAAIARALAARPDLLVCDEVLSALDASVQAQVLALLRRLRERGDLALLWITHDVLSARAIADRVAVMYAGRIVESGPTGDVLAAPEHPYTGALLAATPSLARLARDRAAPPPAAIAGEPPSASDLPGGCAFHPRCPVAEPRCASEPPVPESRAGREVECWAPRRAAGA